MFTHMMKVHLKIWILGIVGTNWKKYLLTRGRLILDMISVHCGSQLKEMFTLTMKVHLKIWFQWFAGINVNRCSLKRGRFIWRFSFSALWAPFEIDAHSQVTFLKMDNWYDGKRIFIVCSQEGTKLCSRMQRVVAHKNWWLSFKKLSKDL